MLRAIPSLLAAALVAMAAGCGGGDDSATSAPEAPAAEDSVELTVMSFNVWYGGGSVEFAQVIEAIRAADADIVGVQEPEGNLRRIAKAAGLPFVDESLHLISRYPLFATERDGIPFALAEVERDRVVAVANAHLTCCPYGPNLVRNGKSAGEVEAVERKLRLPEARPYGKALSSVADEGMPVFLTGDMNSPSHLDWTAEAVEARDLPFELEWPASKALADAGLRDSYREAHPDPATDPGLTWTPGTPPPRVRRDETTDRIDWILSAGPTRTLDSSLIGEEGGPDVDIGVTPWGSDHRAVASTFEAEPAPAPDLVDADPRIVPAGDTVTLRLTLAGRGGGREVGILPGGAAGGDEAIATLPVFDDSDHIAPMLGTGTLSPGPYRAALIEEDGEIIASSPFWVAARGSRPAIETDSASYAPGEAVEVSWRGAPGNKLDYIGIYRAGNPNLYDYLSFRYVDAWPSGRLNFGGSDPGLAPGRYVANLMLDDGYTILATAPFEVGR